MDANFTIDLDAVHQAIVDKIAAQFPAFATVEDYHEDRDRLALPACLLELEDFEGATDDDPGTEQAPVMLRFSVLLAIPGIRNTRAAKREIRRLAGAMTAFVHQQRWGIRGMGPAEILTASPDSFEPELDEYEVWRVEWQQQADLGATVWDGSAFPARVVVQLGQSDYDPNQDDGDQANSTSQPVNAEPVDPMNPGGDWRELPAPDGGGLYSFAPEVGPDHVDKYKPLVPGGDE